MADRLGLPNRQAMANVDVWVSSAPRTGWLMGRGSARSYLVGLLLPLYRVAQGCFE